MKNRGRPFAMAAIAGGVITLAVALLVGRDFLRERYLVWQVKHGDLEAQERALDKLVSLESPAALPLLIQCFADDLSPRPFEDFRVGPPSQWHIPEYRSFSQCTAPFLRLHCNHKRAAASALQGALSDPRPSLRAAACLLIPLLGTEYEAAEFADPLVQLVKADPDDWVRELACNALGAIGANSPAVLTALENAVREEIPPQIKKINAREAAERALRMIRGPQNASESE